MILYIRKLIIQEFSRKLSFWNILKQRNNKNINISEFLFSLYFQKYFKRNRNNKNIDVSEILFLCEYPRVF